MYFILYILQILDKVSKKAWFEPGEKLHSLLNSTHNQIGFTCSFSCLLSGAEKNTHQKRKPRNSVCYCIYTPFTSRTLRLCENLAIDVMVYVWMHIPLFEKDFGRQTLFFMLWKSFQERWARADHRYQMYVHLCIRWQWWCSSSKNSICPYHICMLLKSSFTCIQKNK